MISAVPTCSVHEALVTILPVTSSFTASSSLAGVTRDGDVSGEKSESPEEASAVQSCGGTDSESHEGETDPPPENE